MNWTDEQKQTIETTGRSILVSAAAGSGKTTVLVERIKKLMIDEGTDIDRFLITTFTNAAAAEMRERLEKALRDELKKPDADKPLLTRQLSKLPTASIGTFHSFAFDIVRQYFYLIDVEPGFGVADDVQIEIMKRTAVDNVFARRYEENSEEFRSFVLRYGGSRSDSNLRDNVLETCKTLGSIHKGIEWAHAKANLLASDDPLTAIGGYNYMAGRILEGLEEAAAGYRRAADIASEAGLPLCYEVACGDIGKIEELEQRAQIAFACPDEELRDAIEAFEGLLTAFKAGSMKFKDDGAEEETRDAITNVRNKARNAISGVVKEVYGRSFNDVAEELRGLHADTVYYVGLLEEYYDELKELKAKANVIEFDDALHYAIDILEHPEAADELRERFEYIFVDEYQDSNYLQEEIVEKIAREDNLFMVGDIKQCIYKFRLAEPEIFKARAEAYAAADDVADDVADDADPDGTAAAELLLHISSNFRSKRNVTEPVNTIFGEIMGGYDDAARLHCTADDEYPGFTPRIHLILNEGFDEDAPEKNDAEGAVIAGIIRERLGTEVYDTKKGVMRPLELRDFAVIVRNNREVEDIERYLLNEGIDAYGESGGKYFETVEVQVFINLLRIIENMRQDVPLISAMKSVVFGFTVQELAQIRIAHRKGSFSDAVFACAGLDGASAGVADGASAGAADGRASDGTADGAAAVVDGSADGAVDVVLREKIRSMIRTVDVWKEISRTVPLEDLMKEVLYSTGYYDYCSGLPVGTQRISNLRLIADKASKFEEISHSGLYGFLRYVESMESSDKTDSEAKVMSESEDVVRVMSVHKSKGLEFPVVIFANASKSTDKKNTGGSIRIHREHGIGLPVVNREEHWHRSSLLQKMIAGTARNEMLEEEIRILYVALTRAKDGLEIVGTLKNMDKIDELAGGTSTKSFLEMMYWPLVDMGITDVKIYDDADALAQSHRQLRHTPQQLYAMASELDNEELQSLADARLSYEYPYKSGADIRPKYSVSELNRASHKAVADGGVLGGTSGAADIVIEAFDPDLAKRGSRRGAGSGAGTGAGSGTGANSGPGRLLTAAERGTLMHLLMEKVDFAAAGAAASEDAAGTAASEGAAGAVASERAVRSARDLLQTTADRLLADDIITAEEYDTLSIDKAAAFFESEIGQRAAAAAKAGKLRKEKEFIYRMDAAELAGSQGDAAAGDTAADADDSDTAADSSSPVDADDAVNADGTATIVQGVIDCFFEEGGGIVLIDYKNSYMGSGRSADDIRAAYAGQIDLYRQALEGATGKKVKEAYLFLFDTGEFVRM